MFSWIRHTFLLILLLAQPWGRSLAADYGLLIGENTPAYTDFAEQVQALTVHTGWKMRWLNKTGNPESPATDLVITAGSDALRHALRHYPNTPILAALVSRYTFERAVSDAAPGRTRPASAIVLDQPPARLLAFVGALLPGQRTAAVLVGPENMLQLNQLRGIATSYRVRLEQELLAAEQNPAVLLGELFGRSDFLLALPDGQVYRRENIRPILLTSFRHRKPVIGFSQAQVNAGAMAALYVTPGQVARQVSDLLNNLGPGHFTNSIIQVSSYYSIAINHTVAESLNLALPDEPHIRRAINATVPEREAR